MTTRSSLLRGDAAAIGWALLRSGCLVRWRQCVVAGLALASAIRQAKRSEIESVVADTLGRLARAGEANPQPMEMACDVVVEAWRQRLRFLRAVERSRLGIYEGALIDATSNGKRPTWEELARLSLRRTPRWGREVCVDRHCYAEQVEEFAEREHARRGSSSLSVLMGWEGEA